MKRLILHATIFILLISILCSCGSIQDYDYHFRDNIDSLSKPGNGLDDSGWIIGKEFRDFSSSYDSLVEDQVIPSPEGFSEPYIWAKFDDEHHVIVTSIEWWKEDNIPLTLRVWPEQPEQNDPYYGYSEKHVTTTKKRSCVIIGSGSPSGNKQLNFTLKDGTYCQLNAPAGITTTEMGKVLDFLLENGFNFTPFDYYSGKSIMP